jgi:inorganic pyrophosphatase
MLDVARRGASAVKAIPARNEDGSVNALIEIPQGSRNKYEYDEELGVIALDRTLYSAVHYPTDYGFVPGTRGPDGDRIDVMVMVEESVFPGCLVRVRLIGVMAIRKSGGEPEHKLLAVPVDEPRFAEYRDIADIPKHLLGEIEHFFEVYKDLEGSEIHSLGWEGAERAEAVLDGELEKKGRGPKRGAGAKQGRSRPWGS